MAANPNPTEDNSPPVTQQPRQGTHRNWEPGSWQYQVAENLVSAGMAKGRQSTAAVDRGRPPTRPTSGIRPALPATDVSSTSQRNRSHSLPRIVKGQWPGSQFSVPSTTAGQPEGSNPTTPQTQHSTQWGAGGAEEQSLRRRSRQFDEVSITPSHDQPVPTPVPSMSAPASTTPTRASRTSRTSFDEPLSIELDELNPDFAALVNETLGHPLDPNSATFSASPSTTPTHPRRVPIPGDAHTRSSSRDPVTVMPPPPPITYNPPSPYSSGSTTRPRRRSSNTTSILHQPSLPQIAEDVSNGQETDNNSLVIDIIDTTQPPPEEDHNPHLAGFLFQEPPGPIIPLGSILFLFGFVLPFLWWAGAWWPSPVRTMEDAKWRYLNRLMSVLSVLLIVLVIGLLVWYVKR